MCCGCFGVVFGSSSTVEASNLVPEVVLMIGDAFLRFLGARIRDIITMDENSTSLKFLLSRICVFCHVRIVGFDMGFLPLDFMFFLG